MDPLLLTPEQAFDAIGVGRAYGFELLKKGMIPSIKIGRLRRIPADALRAWVNIRVAKESAEYEVLHEA